MSLPSCSSSFRFVPPFSSSWTVQQDANPEVNAPHYLPDPLPVCFSPSHLRKKTNRCPFYSLSKRCFLGPGSRLRKCPWQPWLDSTQSCSKEKAFFQVKLSTSLFLLGEGMASGREAKAPWLTRFSLSVETHATKGESVFVKHQLFAEAWTVLLLYFPGGHHLHQRLPQPDMPGRRHRKTWEKGGWTLAGLMDQQTKGQG